MPNIKLNNNIDLFFLLISSIIFMLILNFFNRTAIINVMNCTNNEKVKRYIGVELAVGIVILNKLVYIASKGYVNKNETTYGIISAIIALRKLTLNVNIIVIGNTKMLINVLNGLGTNKLVIIPVKDNINIAVSFCLREGVIFIIAVDNNIVTEISIKVKGIESIVNSISFSVVRAFQIVCSISIV